jgi:hypothetical protein
MSQSRLGWPDRPLETVGQIAGVVETLGKLIVQARPFFPNILGRGAMEEVIHLTGIALDVVELVFHIRRGIDFAMAPAFPALAESGGLPPPPSRLK